MRRTLSGMCLVSSLCFVSCGDDDKPEGWEGFRETVERRTEAQEGSAGTDGGGSGVGAKPDELPPLVFNRKDWPCWRGPARNNVAVTDTVPPLKWGPEQNIAWKATPAGRGNATPCIVGDRLFIPAADEDTGSIWVACFARDSGKRLWKTEVYRGTLAEIHEHNSHASATPASDGERIFFSYQALKDVRLAALEFDGTIAWNRKVAPFRSTRGYSASPALYRSTVIVVTDGGGNYITALDRGSGDVAWRTKRSIDQECYVSPLVAKVAGRWGLFTVGPRRTWCYDPNTGAEIWSCPGPAKYCAATIAFNDEMVFATGGYPERVLQGIRVSGRRARIAWKSDDKAGYVPSPLCHEGLLYAVNDSGLFRCYAAVSGAVLWEEDLAADCYSSPVLAAGRLYQFDREGGGYVLAAGRKGRLLAKNALPSGVVADPVVCRGRLYLRTKKRLYAIGE